MKKLLAMILAISMVLTLFACSPKVEENDVTPPIAEDEAPVLPEAGEETAPEVEEEAEDVSGTPEEVPEEKPVEQKPAEKPATQPEQKPEQKPVEQKPTEQQKPVEEQKPVENTKKSPAATLRDDFKSRVSGTTDTEALASALIGNSIIPFMGATMPVEPGFLNGFDNEISGFTKGTMFGPTIGTIAFIGYIFEVDANTDVGTFIQTLKDNANLRWNICTSADEMMVEAVGNTVFFVMAPAEFTE